MSDAAADLARLKYELRLTWDVTENRAIGDVVDDLVAEYPEHTLALREFHGQLAAGLVPEIRFVLASEAFGVFVGHCMGLGFWSKLDAVGQPSAPTYIDVPHALRAAASWDEPIPGVRAHPVLPTGADGYASIADCVAAGLPGWSDK